VIDLPDGIADAPSEAAAKRFMKHAQARASEVLQLRATADQAAGALANELANRAGELSEDLSWDDGATLLRLLASLVVR
jgi:hypothetical protein